MYRPVLDPVGGSLALSALFAMLPLLTLFVLLGVLRMSAWKAALISLLVALLVAVLVYPMPVGQALLAGTEGAAFGFFPILWIVINAIWLYNMTVVTGHFDVLRRSFARVSDDQRIQAVIIAFCFGALLEALAGFGTPVAITSVMLIALGFRPIKAATVALVANTAPVAFGALAVPITTLATVSGESEHVLAQIVGRQTPLLGVFVPMALVYIVDKGKGVRATLPATLTCGIAFAVAQFATSNFLSTQLTDIVAALVGAAVRRAPAAGVAAHRHLRRDRDRRSICERRQHSERGCCRWARPRAVARWTRRGAGARSGVGPRHPDEPVSRPRPSATWAARDEGKVDSTREVVKAYAPYLIIIVLFIIAQLPGIKGALDAPTRSFAWPGLDGLKTASGKTSTLPTFKLNWLSAAGTLMLIAGLLTIPAIGISPAKALQGLCGPPTSSWRRRSLTVMAVLGLAYVMNASGQTAFARVLDGGEPAPRSRSCRRSWAGSAWP